MILYALRFYCQCDHETATASQILLIHMHPYAGGMTQFLRMHDLMSIDI